jgi:hypothetical protein
MKSAWLQILHFILRTVGIAEGGERIILVYFCLVKIYAIKSMLLKN